MDFSDITYAVAYDQPADGPDDHSVDLLRGAPDETDGDDWYPLPAEGDGREAADAALAEAGLRRATPWAHDDDLAGIPGWYARVEASE